MIRRLTVVTVPARLLLRRFRSLQARLVVVSVLLLTVVCTAVGAGAALSLQRYLTAQLDGQVVEAARFRAQPPPSLGNGTRPPPLNAGSGLVGGSPGRPAFTLEVRVRGGSVLAATRSDRQGNDASVAATEVQDAVDVVPGAPPRAVTIADRDYRMVAVAARQRPASGEPALSGTVVVLGIETVGVDSTVSRLVLTEFVVFGSGVLVAGFVAAWATRRTLRPLRRVAATARRVTELPLEQGEVELAERVPPALTDTRSEVGQVGAALNRMLGHVEAALEARQDSETRLRRFVADASHELRTPLAAIRGYTELTMRRTRDLPPEVAAMLQRLDAQTGRMTTLVEDLLLLARLDAGRPLAREPVDLARVVADAVIDAHTVAPSHRWSLDVPEAGADVVGDPERLHQVVANLLTNARKHTPVGTTVTVRLARSGPRTVALDVVDDGPGIPPDLLPHVFERFARAGEGRARAREPASGPDPGTTRAGSTGLGLAIVAAIVGEHGGTIDVTSRPGATRFRVELPVGPLVPSTQRTAPAPTPAGPVRRA